MRPWITRCVIVLVFGIALAPASAALGPPAPAPLYGPRNLHGSITGGWGFTPPTITSPGPPINVSQFETVTLDLFSFDSQSHTFLFDLNQSPIFTSPTTPLRFTFIPTAAPGTYQYFCGIHGPPMVGPFIIRAGNAPPTVSLTNPDGVAQNRWTGGSVKRLTWTMNDPDGLPSQLAVWLNYTSSFSSGPIASPPTLPLGATSFDWTLPLIDANNVLVHIDVADPGGAKGTDANLVPIIDSTRPAVSSTVPLDAAVGIDPNAPLTLTFNEAINTAGPGTVTLNPPAGALTLNWNPAKTVLTLTHPPLARATPYTVTTSNFLDASNPGNAMLPFVFSFTTANDPPAIAVMQPTGTSRWTGGTPHNLLWTTTDTEDAPSDLTDWVNYSATGGAPFSPIAGLQGVPGDTTSFLWTVPLNDTVIARVAFTANDSNGAQTTQLSPAFAIDSTAPSVTSTSPSAAQTNVPLGANMILDFSEPMNTGVTGSSLVVGLEVAGTWIPLAFSWDGSGQQLTANPVPPLAPSTQYRLHVNASAQDRSDPGNLMSALVTVIFTTGLTPDITPPVIQNVAASPSTQIPGGNVVLLANVTDLQGVATVAANVTSPSGSSYNLTMTVAVGSMYTATRTWIGKGTYTFVVWASDTSDNWASLGGSFVIKAVDTTPPEVYHIAHAPVLVGVSIDILALVIDDGTVQQVRLVYTPVGGTELNVTMAASDLNYTFTIPAQIAPGTVRYHFYAIDDAGNEVFTGEFTVTVLAATVPPPPSNNLLYVGIGLLILVASAVAVFLVMRRRPKDKPPERDGTEPPPSGN